MRIALALVLSVALLLSSTEAPFFHVHDEHGDHHGGLVLHTHLSAHHSGEESAMGSAEEESAAKELNWFQLEQPAAQGLPSILTASSSFEIPQAGSARVHRERTRIHGPPSPSSLHSRAPPA